MDLSCEVASLSVNFKGASLSQIFCVDDDEDDVVGMVNDVAEELLDCHEQFTILGDAEKLFYGSCANNFTELSAIKGLSR